MRNARIHSGARAGAAGDRAKGAHAARDRHRLRRLSARWVTIAGLVLVAPAVAFVGVRVATPTDGAHVRPGSDGVTAHGLVIAPLAPGPLQEGDVVTAIGGVAMETLAGALTPRPAGTDTEVAARPPHVESLRELRSTWRLGATVGYDVLRSGEGVRLQVPLVRYPLLPAIARTWGMVLFALVSALVATLVFLRRPDTPAARALFVGSAALVGATTWSLGLQPSDFVRAEGFWLYQATTVGVFMIYWSTIFHFALVFPKPMRLARRHVLLLAYAMPILIAGLYLLIRLPHLGSALARLDAVAAVPGPHAAVCVGAALVVAARQYHTNRSGIARQQIRWVVLAAYMTGTAGLALYILPPLLGGSAVDPNVMGAIVTIFPLSVAVAVLRHNLFDIDTLLNRALVYGSATFGIGAAYVVLVAVLGALFNSRGDLAPALIATGIAAVAFQPLRDRLQRLVNRMMYGERDDPAAVLSRLGARLEEALLPDAILPTLVETVAQALKVPYVSISLAADAELRTVAAYGRSKNAPTTFPLSYRGVRIGRLAIEPRAPDEPFSAGEKALLETIARQASVAAYAVQTTADLRRSRERLVAAREEERRRLRRDLHDGLGPTLAALGLKLDAASNLVERRPGAVRQELENIRLQVQEAVEDLRRVVHALRPPALDDLGLVPALLEHVHRHEQSNLTLSFAAPPDLPPIPAAVELAAYRIVQEALANVVRHADARSCAVTLAVRDGALVIHIDDDGRGMPANPAPGVGLGSMGERAEELGGRCTVLPRAGGGTRVWAELPLEAGR